MLSVDFTGTRPKWYLTSTRVRHLCGTSQAKHCLLPSYPSGTGFIAKPTAAPAPGAQMYTQAAPCKKKKNLLAYLDAWYFFITYFKMLFSNFKVIFLSRILAKYIL